MSATQTTIFNFAQMTGSSPQGSEQATEGVAPPGGGPGGAPPAGPCGGNYTTLIFMAGIFVVFYFLLIRPQQKKAKEHQKMISELKKGDQIVTNGGLIGRITGIADGTLTVEVSEKVRVRVLKSQVNKFENTPEKK